MDVAWWTSIDLKVPESNVDILSEVLLQAENKIVLSPQRQPKPQDDCIEDDSAEVNDFFTGINLEQPISAANESRSVNESHSVNDQNIIKPYKKSFNWGCSWRWNPNDEQSNSERGEDVIRPESVTASEISSNPRDSVSKTYSDSATSYLRTQSTTTEEMQIEIDELVDKATQAALLCADLDLAEQAPEGNIEWRDLYGGSPSSEDDENERPDTPDQKSSQHEMDNPSEERTGTYLSAFIPDEDVSKVRSPIARSPYQERLIGVSSPMPRGRIQSPPPKAINRFTTLHHNARGTTAMTYPQVPHIAIQQDPVTHYVGKDNDEPPSGYRNNERIAWRGKTNTMLKKKKQYGNCC